ncbi:27761_t:CDS:2, partial [Dentiscutata erythropus]
LLQEIYNCDITKKPLRSDANVDHTKKEANEKFEYKQNFSTEFGISFCSTYNSKYKCFKTKKTEKTFQASTQNKKIITQINVQIIIKKNNESSPGKWIKLNVQNSTLFYEDLLEYMNKNIENPISKDNYTITYKANGHEQIMALDDEDDFVAFFKKYKSLSELQHMVIYVNINIKSNNFEHNHKKNAPINNNEISSSDEEIQKKSKKIKKSQIPKESQLNETELEQAQIITEIRAKYQCDIHITPCYIEDNRHLQLTPARLTL